PVLRAAQLQEESLLEILVPVRGAGIAACGAGTWKGVFQF
ncbi:hypothetical protein A2U01_0088783, partial [Trifolium medium]|nr:hypothetical protein [Trifolium medium]